jgi:CheY-like chemotaxis protein
MLRIIQDMLAAFRAGEPEVSRRPQKVSTQRLLLQLVPFVADQAERKGLTLRVEQDKDFPDHFLVEPVALRRILQNLLDNAVKYTDRGGIVLRLCMAGDDRDGAWLCFGVEDTGPGMNGREVARVFEPFSRGDEVGRRSSGLGIGLALSHQLAAALSGTLEVESEPGHGSRFRLLVPARVPDGGSEDPAMPDNGDLAAVHPGTKVLVVDDHPLLSKLTGRALRRLGSEVEVASTAREALLMVQSLTPDVIIIDLDLPDMSGFDLCRDLAAREHLADCRFVAYTGSDGSASRKAAEQAGFSAYLVKPASAEELLGI